ncbi:MAG: heavy metal translocating P-type ATPase, partial [Nitrospirota bacterium]
MSKMNCDHCLATVSRDDAVIADLDGHRRTFCCTGCLGVYSLLRESGLGEFYNKRKDWQAGRPDFSKVSDELFKEHVRDYNGKSEIDISLSGIRCASCVWLIERYLGKIKGIISARVNYATHKARISWSKSEIDLKLILEHLSTIGYLPLPLTGDERGERLSNEKRDLLLRLGTASFFSMQLMIYSVALYAGYFQGIEPIYRSVFKHIAWGLATPVMFYSGFPFIRNFLLGIRHRVVNMDTLIFLGSFSAYTYSIIMVFSNGEVFFDTSSMIITLILLGRYIESGAKAKASDAISRLVRLQPRKARLLSKSAKDKGDGTGTVTVNTETLKVDDVIEVIPGDIIPVDCDVIDGSSEIDESMLTGESIPVSKTASAIVYAGTKNLNGRLVLRVARTDKDTVLSKIISTVEEALARKAPAQRVADKMIRWFVPAILTLAASAFIYWSQSGAGLRTSLMNSISVLVVACPCALGLATPLAILVGTSISYAKGILVRGGDILELTARVDAITFDKTGTLTAGKPSLVSIVPYDIDEHELHILGASIEKSSDHVVAHAIKKNIPPSDMHDVKELKALPGRGIRGTIEGERICAGNLPFLNENMIKITVEQLDDHRSLSNEGNTVTGLSRNDTLLGWFSISDTIRDDAEVVVRSLSQKFNVSMMTGD